MPDAELTNETETAEPDRESFHFTRRQSIALVFGCTLFGATAQMLIKSGADNLASASPVEMITNGPLFLGYALYGISTVLLVLALRDGSLSILYPVISLTYVWVTILSVVVLNESMNVFKTIGVATIVLGVAILGKNGKQ